jgi:uncharacterized membrane protein
MVIGAYIRVYFNNRHAGRTLWWIPLTTAVALAGLALWMRPAPTPAATTTVTFARIFPIVQQRCAYCHSLHPRSTQFTSAPKGVLFDTAQEIASQAQLIETVAVQSTLMPLGNATHMTTAERQLLGRWIAAGAKTSP